MLVKYYDKNGLKIIKRRYDYEKTDGFNHCVAIDEILEDIPNVPIPKIQFKPSANPRLCHTVANDLLEKSKLDYF